MVTLKEQILNLLSTEDSLTDRELTDRIKGVNAPQQSINIACREMVGKGIIGRVKRRDGLLGNNLLDFKSESKREETIISAACEDTIKREEVFLSEEEIKHILNNYLIAEGWKTQVAWGKTHGIDIDAFNGKKQRWIIEVKGCGSRSAMRVNYFLAIIGETLQRMNDQNAKYSIALPDMKQYRNLWNRLPRLAKERTGISILFVNEESEIEEVM